MKTKPHEINLTPIEMGCLSLVAIDEETGMETANVILADYELNDAIQLGKRYAKHGNRVEVFYLRGE